MRILNVGDFNWMTGRERDTANVDLFAIRQKLSRAAIRAGHMVVEFSDRAVARAASPLRLRRIGRAAANRAFLQFVDEVRPDLILLNFADEVDAASLAEARRLSPGVTLVDINIDPLPDPKTRARLAARRGLVDAMFLTTAGAGLAGLAGPRGFAAYMPNPVDRAVEAGRAFETAAPTVDVILPAGDDGLRQVGAARLRPSQAVERLRKASPGLRASAPGIEGPRLRGRAYFAALEQARIGWAMSRWNDQPLYASDRMAHMLGSGLATLLDRGTGFQSLYGEDAVGFYDDVDQAAARVRAWLADDAARREAARRGWDRTWAPFEAGRVFDYLLRQLYDDGGARAFEWPSQRWKG